MSRENYRLRVTCRVARDALCFIAQRLQFSQLLLLTSFSHLLKTRSGGREDIFPHRDNFKRSSAHGGRGNEHGQPGGAQLAESSALNQAEI